MAHIVVRGFTLNRTLLSRVGLFRKAVSPSSSSPISANPVSNNVVKRNFMSSLYQYRLLRQTQQRQAGGSGAHMPGWLSKFLGDKPTYNRFSGRWWWDKVVVCVVFAITGSTTAYFVRPFVEQVLHLDVLVGTVFGRHAFFKKFAKRMWTRMIPRF